VESSYERAVADKLVEQGRAFMKPMRYDVGADLVLPDFILDGHDQGSPAGSLRQG
jgi:hypothetical protein